MKSIFNSLISLLKKNVDSGKDARTLKSNANKLFRLRQDGSPAFDYSFMMGLKEKDYPKYLKKAYYIKTGQKLNLKHPKTFNEKIQWLKIYDNLPIKTQLTDKVLVRDWVKEKIGEEYLKPVLWIGKRFDDIPFRELPDKIIIKCAHGCKWQFIIKKTSAFLEDKRIYNYIKNYFDNWMNQSFFGWSDFELQYKNIDPKIIIEPYLKEISGEFPLEYEIYCFNSIPKLFIVAHFNLENKLRQAFMYDEEYFSVFDKNKEEGNKINDENLKRAVALSKELAKGFKFVRVDWMLCKNKLYFNEMTFTPLSGYMFIFDKIINREEVNPLLYKLGDMLSLKGENNG